MTATDRPRRRMSLRHRCHTSPRVSVIRTTYPLMPWQIVIPGVDPGERDKPRFVSYDEAIHEAHRIANIRAVRAIVDGAA